jgi:hypothetical protein
MERWRRGCGSRLLLLLLLLLLLKLTGTVAAGTHW